MIFDFWFHNFPLFLFLIFFSCFSIFSFLSCAMFLEFDLMITYIILFEKDTYTYIYIYSTYNRYRILNKPKYEKTKLRCQMFHLHENRVGFFSIMVSCFTRIFVGQRQDLGSERRGQHTPGNRKKKLVQVENVRI